MTPFGTTKDGKDIQKITLTEGDLTVSLLTYGAIVQDVRLAGVDRSLTLGSDNLADYEGEMLYHGALIGPVANRISTARVRLAGMMHELERNQDGRIHLHSGAEATHLQIWDVVDVQKNTATLSIHLRDGVCGLPGNRKITVTFSVTVPATLTMDVEGVTDDLTIMNIANHCYWNLDGSPTYEGHHLQIAADRYLPITDDAAPTGEIADVTGTKMDLRTPTAVKINAPAFDHNFCLSNDMQPIRDVLTLTGASGVKMTMSTTERGLQVFDGRNPKRPGKDFYEGLAIEAQGWPDAPNHAAFPSIKVTPDAPYRQTTKWRFEAD